MSGACCDDCASKARLADAAARAGCHVVHLGTTIVGGERTDGARIVCPSGDATLALLRELADGDAPGARERELGRILRGAYGLGTLDVARGVHGWVKRSIRFRKERRETFQSPRVTLRRGVGDCDDHARLVSSLAGLVGVPAAIVGLYREGEPVHAVTVLRSPKGWHWAETTLDARFGEHPVVAKTRLAASDRSDLAA